MLTGGRDTKLRLWDSSRGYLIEKVAARTTQAEQSPGDVEVWRALADKCTQLGWPDRAHEAFARIKALTGDDARTAAQAAKAHWIFEHALEGARLPEVLGSKGFHVSAEAVDRLSAVRKYSEEGRMRAAVETWRQLAQSEDGKAFLPLARNYFSKAKSWKVNVVYLRQRSQDRSRGLARGGGGSHRRRSTHPLFPLPESQSESAGVGIVQPNRRS